MKGTTSTVPYIDLGMTEEFILFPEDNPGTIPVDNSTQGLRDYSPFVLEVVPPTTEYGLVPSPDSGTPKAFFSPLRPDDSKRRNELVNGSLLTNISSLAGAPITNKTTSQSGLLPTITNLTPAYTDKEGLLDFVTQAHALATLPPIVFMINPSTFEVSYNGIMAFQEQTRYGFVFQRFGEELPTISFSTPIGAYMAGRSDGKVGTSGLHLTSKKDSAAYRHLMAILAVYRNNSVIVDRIGRSRAFHAVGRQRIYFDGQVWEGRIESMSFSEEADKPHGGISFDMSFTVYQHRFVDKLKSSEVTALKNMNINNGGA